MIVKTYPEKDQKWKPLTTLRIKLPDPEGKTACRFMESGHGRLYRAFSGTDGSVYITFSKNQTQWRRIGLRMINVLLNLLPFFEKDDS